MILSPLLDPALQPLDVAFHLITRVARELNDYLLDERIARLLQQDLHDFRVEVLLQFGFGIISAHIRQLLLCFAFASLRVALRALPPASSVAGWV